MLCFRTSSCYFLLSHSEFDRETCRRFWFEGEIGMFCFNASSRFFLLLRSQFDIETSIRFWFKGAIGLFCSTCASFLDSLLLQSKFNSETSGCLESLVIHRSKAIPTVVISIIQSVCDLSIPLSVFLAFASMLENGLHSACSQYALDLGEGIIMMSPNK